MRVSELDADELSNYIDVARLCSAGFIIRINFFNIYDNCSAEIYATHFKYDNCFECNLMKDAYIYARRQTESAKMRY